MSNETKLNIDMKAVTGYGVVMGVDFSIGIEDSEKGLVYVNLAMDAVALVLAAIGKIFTEFELTGDAGKRDAQIKKLISGIDAFAE